MATDTWIRNSIRGGFAGGLATVGMTAAMVLMHRCLPGRQRYGLPPEQIVDEVLEKTGGDDRLSPQQIESLAMVVHHGYGTTMGAVYGALAPDVPSRPLISGVCFGMVVWAVGYLGWLPALKMDASATREPAERNALTITAHLIWGGTLGLLASGPIMNQSKGGAKAPPDKRIQVG